jgi:hypothetical protein
VPEATGDHPRDGGMGNVDGAQVIDFDRTPVISTVFCRKSIGCPVLILCTHYSARVLRYANDANACSIRMPIRCVGPGYRAEVTRTSPPEVL